MINVKNLYHSYNHDGVYAVKDATFEIPTGEVFGFLGPSGAGKSTTQSILTGLLPLQKGEVTVAGYDVKTIKREMFNKSFKEWGTTYIEFSPKDVSRITNEFSLPYLDKIAKEQGPKDARVIKAIEIIKQFMKDRGYIN